MLRDELGTVGPSKEFIAQMMAEEEIGSGIVEIEVVSPCCEEEQNALPKVISVLPVILEWIESVASERVNFYSAREKQEAPLLQPATKKANPKKAAKATSQLALMQQQLSAVMTQQEALAKSSLHVAVAGYADLVPEQPGGLQALRAPSLSAGIMGGTAPKQAANLLGPPPHTKAAGQTPVPDVEALAVPIPGPFVGGGDGQMLGAISQQTLAIMQLVAHLVGGDPTQDFASSSTTSGLGLNTKGVARREKMQSDLASRSSNYFLQVQQQLYERMNLQRSCLRQGYL